MDSLEKFIKNNKESFDSDVPNLKVWAAIDKELDQKRPEPKQRFLFGNGWAMGIAASMLLVVGCFAGLFFSNSGTAPSKMIAEAVSPEFKEAEQFYKTQYDEKRAQLANFSVEPSFQDDLEEFEKIIADMKIDLSEVPKGNRERILSAIIKNYQTKIEVLEKMLDRMENLESEHSKQKKNETSI